MAGTQKKKKKKDWYPGMEANGYNLSIQKTGYRHSELNWTKF